MTPSRQTWSSALLWVWALLLAVPITLIALVVAFSWVSQAWSDRQFYAQSPILAGLPVDEFSRDRRGKSNCGAGLEPQSGELTRRLNERFPPGTTVSFIRDALTKEGFEVGDTDSRGRAAAMRRERRKQNDLFSSTQWKWTAGWRTNQDDRIVDLCGQVESFLD